MPLDSFEPETAAIVEPVILPMPAGSDVLLGIEISQLRFVNV